MKTKLMFIFSLINIANYLFIYMYNYNYFCIYKHLLFVNNEDR